VNYTIRQKQNSDNAAVNSLMLETWHTISIITRGKMYPIADLQGFVAENEKKLVGLVCYRIEENECEIIVLQSMAEKQGIGTNLILEVINEARKHSCKRVWLITTNDNTDAMHFYQKRGFVFSALYSNAMDVSRKMAPRIPLLGHDNIPLRDEIEFEYII